MCEGIRNSRRITQPVIQTAHCGFAALTPSCSRGDSISPSSSAFWVSIGFIQSCFRRVYPVVFLSDFCRVYPIGFLSGLSRRVSVGLIWSCFSWVYAVVFPSGFCRVYPVVFPLGLPGRVSVGFIPSGFCRVYPVVFPWGLPGRVSVGFLSGLSGRVSLGFTRSCFRRVSVGLIRSCFRRVSVGLTRSFSLVVFPLPGRVSIRRSCCVASGRLRASPLFFPHPPTLLLHLRSAVTGVIKAIFGLYAATM